MKSYIMIIATLVFVTGCKAPNGVDTIAPYPPQGLGTISLDNAVQIDWLPSQDANVDGYNIWRNLAPTGRFVMIGSTSQTYYVDATANNGTTYYYRVSAFDVAGNESEMSLEVVHDTPRPEGYGVQLSDAGTVPALGGYDFSAYSVERYDDTVTDVFFERAGGVNYLDVWSDTDIQDMGYTTSLDEITAAPSNGWAPSKSVEAIAGHTYVVWTWDDHYAKMYVTSVSPTSITFDWAYQTTPGNRELKRAPDARGNRAPLKRLASY